MSELKTQAESVDALLNAQPGPAVLEPTDEAILDYQRTHGFSWDYSREQLLERAKSEALKYSAVSPAEWDTVIQAQREADEARERAGQLAQDRKAFIGSLESALVVRAKHMMTVEQLRGLRDASLKLDDLAAQALDSFILSVESPGPLHQSQWDVTCDRLAKLTALKPFLPARLKAVELRAAEMTRTIQDNARQQKVNLVSLLTIMRVDCQRLNDQRQMRDAALWQLFCDGFMELPDK